MAICCLCSLFCSREAELDKLHDALRLAVCQRVDSSNSSRSRSSSTTRFGCGSECSNINCGKLTKRKFVVAEERGQSREQGVVTAST